MKFRKVLIKEPCMGQVTVISFLNILLIFFAFLMLGAGFTVVPGVNVKLPDVITADELRSALDIVISKEDSLYIQNKPVSISDVRMFLKKDKYDSVFIKADKDSTVSILTAIWEECKDAGIAKISFATTQ